MITASSLPLCLKQSLRHEFVAAVAAAADDDACSNRVSAACIRLSAVVKSHSDWT